MFFGLCSFFAVLKVELSWMRWFSIQLWWFALLLRHRLICAAYTENGVESPLNCVSIIYRRHSCFNGMQEAPFWWLNLFVMLGLSEERPFIGEPEYGNCEDLSRRWKCTWIFSTCMSPFVFVPGFRTQVNYTWDFFWDVFWIELREVKTDVLSHPYVL